MITMHAASRPADDIDAEPHRWTIQADDYDTAYAEAHASLPEGWILQHVQVDR